MDECCHLFCSALSSVTVSSCLSVILDWQAVQLLLCASQQSLYFCQLLRLPLRLFGERQSVGFNMTSHLSRCCPQTSQSTAPHDSGDNTDGSWSAADAYSGFRVNNSDGRNLSFHPSLGWDTSSFHICQVENHRTSSLRLQWAIFIVASSTDWFVAWYMSLCVIQMSCFVLPTVQNKYIKFTFT